MRAWQVRRPGEPLDVLELVELEPPEPGEGLVRLDVRAAALGLPDVFMCRGVYPLTPELPFTPGQEVCGIVSAVGAGVDEGLIGQRVLGVTAFYLGSGGLAEQTLAAAANLHPVAPSMSDRDAAGFYIPYHTGWIGLHTRGRLAAGETLLVLGAAGGSGAAAVQLGKALGARVVAVAGGSDKAAFCEGLGADIVIDHHSVDVREAVEAELGRRAVDVIYDPVGGDAARVALRTIANEGRHLLVGFAAGEWASASGADIALRNYSMVGVYAGAYGRDYSEAAHAELLALVDGGALPSIVTDEAPFAEAAALVGRLADRSAIGKAVVTVA